MKKEKKKQKARLCLFVDTENVGYGLGDRLLPGMEVYFYQTFADRSRNLPEWLSTKRFHIIDLHDRIRRNKNELDMILIADLGMRIGAESDKKRKRTAYMILSKDKGYDAVIENIRLAYPDIRLERSERDLAGIVADLEQIEAEKAAKAKEQDTEADQNTVAQENELPAPTEKKAAGQDQAAPKKGKSRKKITRTIQSNPEPELVQTQAEQAKASPEEPDPLWGKTDPEFLILHPELKPRALKASNYESFRKTLRRKPAKDLRIYPCEGYPDMWIEYDFFDDLYLFYKSGARQKTCDSFAEAQAEYEATKVLYDRPKVEHPKAQKKSKRDSQRKRKKAHARQQEADYFDALSDPNDTYEQDLVDVLCSYDGYIPGAPDDIDLSDLPF